MIDRRAQRDNSISIFRIIAVVCAVCVLAYFIFALATGIEPIATVIACTLLCIFLCIFIYLTLNPDSVRSQYTEETLSVASAMLEDIKGVGSDGSHNHVPAGIIAPIKVGDRTVGTLKFYYKTPRAVDRTQYALASGFAEILSTQLAIHELEVQKELTARAEVRALQAQINPHFLFNTLNTIASFTRTDPLRARELLREFSSFYRATLDNSGSLIPVSREVAQTKRYLTFEKARFGEDRVLATFDVSEDVEDTLVPAFVIQPIVENAVRHGMGDGDALQIDVTVHQDGDDAILIAVADNGVGMDEGTAARLFDERSARPDASSPQGGGAGVAMHNISERIHRFYGPHSYTRVESAPGKGTKVLLHLDLSESIFDIQE